MSAILCARGPKVCVRTLFHFCDSQLLICKLSHVFTGSLFRFSLSHLFTFSLSHWPTFSLSRFRSHQQTVGSDLSINFRTQQTLKFLLKSDHGSVRNCKCFCFEHLLGNATGLYCQFWATPENLRLLFSPTDT